MLHAASLCCTALASLLGLWASPSAQDKTQASHSASQVMPQDAALRDLVTQYFDASQSPHRIVNRGARYII